MESEFVIDPRGAAADRAGIGPINFPRDAGGHAVILAALYNLMGIGSSEASGTRGRSV